jgi:hypothetical protein
MALTMYMQYMQYMHGPQSTMMLISHCLLADWMALTMCMQYMQYMHGSPEYDDAN